MVQTQKIWARWDGNPCQPQGPQLAEHNCIDQA